MTDLALLESELTAHHPEPWVRLHLASFPEAYFATFDTKDVARHLARIIALTDDHPVAIDVWPECAGSWRLEVVGHDAFQLLSTLCMSLAIHGLSILEGQVFTSRPAPLESRPGGPKGRRPATSQGPDRRPKIVDQFRVRWDGPTGEPDWDAFQAELMTLVRLLRADQHDEVQHHLIGRYVAALASHRALPAVPEALELTIDPDASESATEVRVSARDRFGFLSLATGALALCGFAIVQADIRTQAGRVVDTFQVVDPFGRRIPPGPRLEGLRLALLLVAHYSAYLPSAANPEAALVHFSRFATETMAGADWARDYATLDRPEVLDALVRVLGESDFLWEDYLHAQPENLLPMISEPTQWRHARTPAELAADRDAALAVADAGIDARGQALRRFRDREFFRAGVRAILSLSGGPDGFSAELTDVADALLQGAARIAADELSAALPRQHDGHPAPWVLFALGKCGGRELGFGSDLELLLVYDDRALAESGAGFDRFVTVLRQVLAAPRGRTLEADFRLRPYGRSGPPATALSAFTTYYGPGGPAWSYERQALIKLRPVAGDPALGREVESIRDAVVYGPESFDLEGCRRLRRLQVGQLVRPGTLNAKYSPGALVDVEYFVQALQMTHGAHDPALRTPNTARAIEALAASGRLAPEQVALLRTGYHFFRTLIDALRVVRGHAKDLIVPPAGSDEFRRLAERLHQPAAPQLQTTLETTLGAVRRLWDDAERLLTRPG